MLSHLGPGLTNAATGVANAALDSVPMVVIAGDVPTHYHGKHPHQEVNLHADASQFEIYRPFVKRAWRVDQPHLFPEIIEKAFTLAESGRPGPVLVDVPMDIFSKEIDVALFDRLRLNTKTLHKPTIDEETAAEIVRKLVAAQHPLLYVGGGIIRADASAELREFVDHLQIPVALHADGQGRAARRPSVRPRHDGLLGHQVHQRAMPRRRRRSSASARGSRKPTAARGSPSTRSTSRRRSSSTSTSIRPRSAATIRSRSAPWPTSSRR